MNVQHNWSSWRRDNAQRIVLLFVLLAVSGAGCVRITTRGASSAVYESLDGGKQWSPANRILSVKEEAIRLPLTEPAVFQFDASDSSTLYLSTLDGALYQSTDAAASWKTLERSRDPILALDVDPKHPCTLYASRAIRIEKSLDCGRRWDPILQLPEQVAILAIRVNPAATSMVVAGTDRGDLYMSRNDGTHWISPLRIPDRIGEILFSPSSPQDIFVFGTGGSVYRSSDLGNNWTDLSLALRSVAQGSPFRAVSVNSKNPAELIVATQRFLVRSTDRGQTWSTIPLLPSPQLSAITALAVDPMDARILYYMSSTTLYRSANTGQTWQSFPLPGNTPARQLLIDPARRGHLYLVVSP